MSRFLLTLLVSMLSVGAFAADLKIHGAIQQGSLTIFPVSGGVVADTSRYLTLDEGLKRDLVKVGEMGVLRGTGVMVRPGPDGAMRRPNNPAVQTAVTGGDGARVSELAIQNLSSMPLLLLAGEVVSGGKQDRVVSKDLIVPPHSEPVPLGVFCVEPGRWSGKTGAFGASKAMAHPKLRMEVTESKDQRKVWEEVGRANKEVLAYSTRAAIASGAVAAAPPERPGSFAQVMEHRPVQDKLDADNRVLLNGIPRAARGVVVALNGRPLWADLFASPELFERYRAKLMQSYQVEAMRAGATTAAAPTGEQARDFLGHLEGRQTIDVQPGVFRLVRTDADGTVTYELISTGQRDVTVHLSRMKQ